MRRHRRASAPAHGSAIAERIPARQLPGVNHRVSVAMGEHVPVPSRVEDIRDDALVLAAPALALDPGDQVVVNWEQDGAWFSLTTRVSAVDRNAFVPTIDLSTCGQLRRHDERRTNERIAVELSVDARIIQARAIRAGRELQVRTSEVGPGAVRFSTSAPFAPEDVVEVRIALGTGVEDIVSARVRVMRVETVSGSWRSTVTAAFDEILRSDRARLLATAAAIAPKPKPLDTTALAPMTPPPTLDGVGGRDEPESIDTLDAAVEWLRRRG
jgi:hypothetical protein